MKAIAVHAESRGASGLTALIAHRRRLNEKNEKAWKEKKGTKAPQHKAFWDTLHKICDTDLKELADAHGDADAVFAEFAHRLSTELMWERRNNEARK
ncbi:MAG: hypothetical protein HY897_09065 [Deltaproteobacteria bacterium]|nr:hypothetical protein [Deltaproteobacteria bacterium]